VLIASLGTWILHYTGCDNLSGPWYGFWSGFGSDLGELLLLGGLVTLVRHHNCHVKGCWKIGHIDPAVHAPACGSHHSHRSLRGKIPPEAG